MPHFYFTINLIKCSDPYAKKIPTCTQRPRHVTNDIEIPRRFAVVEDRGKRIDLARFQKARWQWISLWPCITASRGPLLLILCVTLQFRDVTFPPPNFSSLHSNPDSHSHEPNFFREESTKRNNIVLPRWCQEIFLHTKCLDSLIRTFY